MQSLNQYQAIGNLGKEVTMRFTPSGREVTVGSIAMNRKYRTGDGEQHTEVEWVDWEAWGNLAKIINEYAKPGQKVFFQGRLKTEKYANKNYPDVTMTKTKLVVLECILLGGNSTVVNNNSGDESGEDVTVELPSEEDIPF